jgi:hypothetical protein
MAEVPAMPFACGEIAWVPAYDVQVSTLNNVVDTRLVISANRNAASQM